MQLELFKIESPPVPQRETPPAVLELAKVLMAEESVAIKLAVDAGLLSEPVALKNLDTPLYAQVWGLYWEQNPRSEPPESEEPQARNTARETTPQRKTRKWSPEAKARERQRRLRERVHKKFSIPELAEAEYERKLKTNEDYYLCRQGA